MDHITSWVKHTVCQGDPFPIYDGWLSPCLQDVAVYIVLDLFMIIFGTFRILHLHRNAEKLYDIPRTLTYLLKNALHVILLALFVSEIILHQWRSTWGPYYDVAKDAGNVIVWGMSWLLVTTEHSRGHRQNWILRAWWTLCFLGWSVTIKYATNLHLATLDLALLIAEYSFVAAICIIGLFFNRVPVVVDAEDQTHYGTFAGANLTRKYDLCDDDETEGVEVSGGPSKEHKANVISAAVYWWVSGLLKLGFKRPLQQVDLDELHPMDESSTLSAEFQEIWARERKEKKPSIKRALRRFVQKDFAKAGIFKLGNDIFVFTGPLVLNGVISFLTSSQPLWVGVVWTAGLFVGSAIQSLCSNQYFFRGYRVGLHMRTALIAAVYQKSFKLTNGARQKSTTGEIVNLQAIDAQKMADLMPFLHMVWSAPLQIAIATAWLVFILGPSALAGLGIMVLLIPFNIWLARTQGKLQKQIMKIKDSRAKRMNEILNGIRVVKFFVWETSMSASVLEIRTAELKLLRHSAYLRAGTILLWTSTPILVAVGTFTAYALTGHELTPVVAFTSLALFNILRFPLNMLPSVISSMVESGVSLGRIQTYLANEELDPHATIFEQEPKDPAIKMQQGSFAWEDPNTRALSDVSFEVRKGELLAIIAPVGVGKSSLMAALLGDMVKLGGTTEMSGSIAYVSQQAWIQNATVRDNILFGSEFENSKYRATLVACQLEKDLEVLPDGDLTEIGEKGINLSGGQKQRVNCARAVYQMADVYLFDDPLSAVDAHVGRNLFDQCLKGILKGKTRVLITHQLQYLSEVDRVLVLKESSSGSTVAEFGTYDELMKKSADFTKMIHDHVTSHEESTSPPPQDNEDTQGDNTVNAQGGAFNIQDGSAKSRSPKEKVPSKEPPKKLMTVEERRTGHVGGSIYKQYLSAFPGGLCVGFIILAMFILAQVASISSNLWLANWSNKGAEAANNVMFYLGIYAALGLSGPLFVIVRSFLVALCGLGAAKKFHERMLRSAMRAPVSFFDTTPIGRILNRFTKDIADVDQQVSPVLTQFADMAFSVVGVLVVISLATPWFLVPMVPLAYFYKYIQRYYVRTSRELKRLDSISKSPIFAHFSETLSGVSIIRAYKRIAVFVHENEHKLNENAKAYFSLFAANRWLAIRLEFIGYSVVTLAAFFAVFGKGSINAGLAGLAMSYSLSLTGLLNMAVRQSAEVENQLVSVERVMEYTTLPEEAPETSSRPVPKEWPAEGKIEFENVTMRYRPDLPLVLKRVSFAIKPQEKIGIVGRTGSGKSSMVLALFRIVELIEGSIKVDGIDIKSLGLDDARSRLSIIPQDPILFTGSVRSNVDPTDSYSEAEIWKALESVHMKHAVETLATKLDSPVTEAGENFSVGQRQLLCLARALLKRSKVIVMDEATAAVDMQTDSLIQNTIRTQFASMTVVTIAHRIHTILDYDRIVVMDNGNVVELDSPQTLLANPKSVFAALVNESKH